MSCSSRRISARLGLTSCVVTALGLAGAASASAVTTIGQLAPGNSPPATCFFPADTNIDYVQPSAVGGPSYVVPAGGAAVTSWSTKAAIGANQQFKLKAFRKVAEPATYQVVGHDGPHTLASGVLNTFPVNLPVQPGDVIGLHTQVNSGDSACIFDSPGNNVITPDNFGDASDGTNATFNPNNPFTDSSLNLSAVVALKASNDFDFVKVKKNKSKGTAVLTVDVPGPGELSLGGTGVKPQRAGGATISKDVTAAGKVKLKVKAKGSKKVKLLNTGKVKVKAKVTFTPSKGSADLPGDPKTQPKKIKLIDN